jgi:hypothetical protein
VRRAGRERGEHDHVEVTFEHFSFHKLKLPLAMLGVNGQPTQLLPYPIADFVQSGARADLIRLGGRRTAHAARAGHFPTQSDRQAAGARDHVRGAAALP